MIIIDKEIEISEINQKIEFEVENVPSGKYNAHLVLETEDKLPGRVDFASWLCDFKIPANMTFSREEIYGDIDNI